MPRNIFNRKKKTSDTGGSSSTSRVREEETRNRSEDDEARISNDTTMEHSADDDDEGQIEVPVPNSRKLCRVWNHRLVCDEDPVDSRISRCMTEIFKKSIVENGFLWKNIPPAHIDMYFDEFKKFYRWHEDEAIIKHTFIVHGRRRYSDMVNKWKKDRARRVPLSLSAECWANFCAHWDREDTVAKSVKMSANRRSETGGPGTGLSKHVGGSRSTRGHALILEKQLGRQPEYFELMHATHYKKDGSGYCDPRAAQIAADYEARKAALEGAESDGSVNMNDLYIEVAGTQKNRIFGTGEIGASYKTLVPSSSSSQQGGDEELRRQVAQMRAEMEEERARRRTEAEEERAVREGMQRDLAAALKLIHEKFGDGSGSS